jgi:rhodanese-related sulfurtransferase
VLFCLSKTCWLSHNAAVRAVALGYRKVFWCRGGREAWVAAGLAMEPVHPLAF